jgi:uncharacterized protein (DUF2267 family)
MCRYEMLDTVAKDLRGSAADFTFKVLTAVMETIARILPTEAARLAPPLSKVHSQS